MIYWEQVLRTVGIVVAVIILIYFYMGMRKM
jgi:hypothetical protein